MVDRNRWEPRNAQDFVRGVPDYQAVTDPRPLTPNQFVGPQSEELAVDAPVGSLLLALQSLVGITPGDRIGVMLASGSYFFTWALGFVGGLLVIFDPLSGFASSGSVVTDFGPLDSPLTSSFQLEEEGPPVLLEGGAGYLGLEN